MKDSYNFYTDKLTGEYKEVFEQIDLYIGTENTDEQTREERMGQLLDLFLTAQETGKPVQKLVGKNVEAFCKEFCADFNWTNQVWRVLDSVKSLAKFLLAVSGIDLLFLLIDWLDEVPVDFWTYPTSLNLGGYLMGLAVASAMAWGSNFLIRRLMFRTGRVSVKVLRAATWIAAIATFFVMMALMFSDRTNVISYPVWLEAAVSGGYLLLYRFLNRKFRREDSREKIKFSQLVEAEIENSFGDDMEKDYARANKRSVKRGKGELSREDYIAKQEKRCRSREKGVWFYYVYPALVTVLCSIPMALDGGFEGWVDTLIFFAIMLVIQYALALFFKKLDVQYTRNLRKWLEEQK